MPKKESKKEIEEGTRNLLDKIGTAGEGFSVFLGAGASKTAGFPTMKELADILENEISNSDNGEAHKFLKEIIAILKSESQDGITIEKILEMIYHLHFLTEKREDRISFTLGKLGKISLSDLNLSINFIKNFIWIKCYKIEPVKLQSHIDFLQCLMGMPGRIRKLNIFTTNWDFAIEMTCDELKYKCVDGFIGMFNAFEMFDVFSETPSEQFPTVYLYKLHGSLNWLLEEENKELRKKMDWNEIAHSDRKRFMIYPIPSKSREILGYPYADLISRFSDALKQEHPLLLVIGYNFTDSHVVTKISSMLQNNEHSNLFIIDPNLKLEKVSETLDINAKDDARVTLLHTDFAGFTNILKELSKNE
ncbi:MAG: SIR2 family protein [Candidatus Heimdallarchaeaceae archaeon]